MFSGIKGTIRVSGESSDFSINADNFADVAGFPPSQPPQSHIKAGDETDVSYVETDKYTDAMVKDASGDKRALVNLVHSLQAARTESDRIFTQAIEKLTPGGALGALVSGALHDAEDEGKIDNEEQTGSVNKKRKVA